MAWDKSKKWLETNRVWFETITALLLSLMAIVVGFTQCSIMNKQTEIAHMQYQSGIDPSIFVELIDMGVGKNGVYQLKIINNGTLDISDISIYENYLHCNKRKKALFLLELDGELLQLDPNNFSVSGFSILPSKKIALLEPGDNVPITIDIKNYIHETADGKIYPCFLRIRVEYIKKVDGKHYQNLYAFAITNVLTDLDSESVRFSIGDRPSVVKARNLLLNK